MESDKDEKEEHGSEGKNGEEMLIISGLRWISLCLVGTNRIFPSSLPNVPFSPFLLIDNEYFASLTLTMHG